MSGNCKFFGFVMIYLSYNMIVSCGVSFGLNSGQKTCLSQDANAGDVLSGSWNLARPNGKTELGVELRVIYLSGNNDELFTSKDDKGTFSVSITRDSEIDVCFTNRDDSVRAVTLNIDESTSNKINDKNQAKKEHIEPIAQALRQIVYSAQHLINDLEHLKEQEWEMRDINGMHKHILSHLLVQFANQKVNIFLSFFFVTVCL